MGRFLRWTGIGIAALVALAVLAYGAAYVLSERTLRKTFSVPAAMPAVPTDEASVAEGRRLATVLGCFPGCHGRQGEGAVMFDQPAIARVVAPGLASAARQLGDKGLADAIRHGVRPDGRTLAVMPSQAYASLSDADLGRLIAYLKSLPALAGTPGAGVTPGPLGRIGFATGKLKATAQLVAEAVEPPPASGEASARGRYLAKAACGHCHGTSLRGDSNPEFTSPDLAVVGSYSAEAFTTLLRKGEAVGGRQVGLMSTTARGNLALLTDEEIAAVYGYLRGDFSRAGPR